jgi:hypothetical protein
MDGVEWVNPTDGLETSLRSVTAGHGLFVAINLSGALVASTGGNS